MICGKQLLQDVLRHTGGGHPRILLTAEDFARLRMENNPIYTAGRENLFRQADELTQTNADGTYCLPLVTYDIPDGIRLLATSRKVLDRVMTLAMAWQLTGKEVYALRAIAELDAAARFPDWNPYHFLDVGEMTCAFAIGYDWLYHYLDEPQRRRLRVAIVEKGVRQIQADYRDYFRRRSYRWYQDDPGDNWKYICNGGVSIGCLAIFDEVPEEEPLFIEVLEHAFADTYTAVRNMYLPDGSYGESFTYWDYATTYLAYYAATLRTTTGTDYGLTQYAPLQKSPYYVKYFCSNDFICFNFGDSGNSPQHMSVPIFLWFARHFSLGDVGAIRGEYLLAHPEKIAVADLIWYDHRLVTTFAPKQLDMAGTDNAVFREDWSGECFYAAIHFGNNDAYHHHSDTGTFIVDWADTRFFCDLGADNYNVEDYYKTYRYRAEGHNVPVFLPVTYRDQAADSHCPITSYHSDEQEAYAQCDMTAAYFGTPVLRGMKLSRKTRTLLIQDEISCAADVSGLWFAHTQADITLSADGSTATLTRDGRSLTVRLLTGQQFEVRSADLLDSTMHQHDQRDNTAFRKLTVPFTGPGTIAVAISPQFDTVPDVIALKNW